MFGLGMHRKALSWASACNQNILKETRVLFPYSNGHFLKNEIVIGLNEQLYMNTGCVGEAPINDVDYLCDLSPWEVLVSGQFRLMRPIKGIKND